MFAFYSKKIHGSFFSYRSAEKERSMLCEITGFIPTCMGCFGKCGRKVGSEWHFNMDLMYLRVSQTSVVEKFFPLLIDSLG